MKHLATINSTAQTIATELAVAAYTATADVKVEANLLLTGLAGNGIYSIGWRIHDGTANRDSARTLYTVPSGQTTLLIPPYARSLRNGYVLSLLVTGLAADTSVTIGGIVVQLDELTKDTWTDAKAAFIDVATSSRLAPTVANRTLDIAETGEAGIDLSNIKQATGATTLSNITVPTVTTLTNLPSIPANWITAAGIATGAIDADALAADAVAEIQSGLATSADVSVTITPIVASASSPAYTTRDLGTIWQHSAPSYAVRVVDSTGAAVSLTGKTVRMLVASVSSEGEDDDTTDDTIVAEYKYETGGDGITVSDTNLVTIQHAAVNTATVGKFRYWLWNTTDTLPLMKGTFKIDPAAFDV